MRCKLCAREAVSDLCRYHEEAKGQVEAAYRLWKEAYGTLGWEDYLREVIKNPETGEWAVEVARLMRASSARGSAAASSS